MKTKTRVLTLLGASVLLLGSFAFKPLEAKKIIVIDAGHGGHDVGADMYGLQEKTIVANIAQKIKEQNKDENLEIVLIREGDSDMALSERVSIINNLNPSLLISLHINASKSFMSNGIGAYISANQKFHDESKQSAEHVVDKVAGNYFSKREVTDAPFYILKNVTCPAMTLTLGFLSNENDRNYISTEKGQGEIATKILEAVK